MTNRLKINKNSNSLCVKGAPKYQKEQYQKRLEAYELNPKKCLRCSSVLEYSVAIKSGRKSAVFCSRSCAASHNNSKRTKTTKGLKKIRKCSLCNKDTEVSLHNSSKTTICSECKPIKKDDEKIKKCSVCKKDFCYSKKIIKTCSPECLKIARRNGAIKGSKMSVASQGRRSKNEVCFYELCKTKFLNVINNEPMFNGWDADVILLDFKVAVLWNGVWHYKKITRAHSVAQVQNRDKIKIKEIQNLGYTPYVIKDLGKFSMKKVEAEFESFCMWLTKQKN